MKRTFLVASLVTLGAGAVFAQSGAIAERQALMKANGKAAQAVAAMLKGAPFDLATVQASLKTFNNAAEKGPGLFPDDSKTGGDTHALPAIWENKADFNAHFAKLGDDSTALLGSIKDEASFKASMPGLFKDCGGCHETYRAKSE
jgi:cytochrome c556